MKTEVARADGPQPETVRVMVCNELICPNLGEQIRSVRFRGTMWCLSVCTPGAGRSVRLRDKAVWNSHTHLYAPVSAFESAERGGGGLNGETFDICEWCRAVGLLRSTS